MSTITCRAQDQNTAATFASAPVQNFDIDSGQPLTASNLIVINSVTHPSVTGTVYLDSNGNATQDSGESGLAGLTVYADINHDGVFDAGDASAVTDADGNYTLTNLAAGTYSIRVAPASGLTLSSPPLGAISVTLAQGQVVAGQNFGEMLAAPRPRLASRIRHRHEPVRPDPEPDLATVSNRGRAARRPCNCSIP